jgi:uncharacterized protein
MQPGVWAKRVIIRIGGAEQHVRRTCTRVPERLRDESAVSVAGFTSVAAIDAVGRLQEPRLAEVVLDLPMLVVCVDTPERVQHILPHIGDLLTEGTITAEDVQVVYHSTRAVPDLPPAVTVRAELDVRHAAELMLKRELKRLLVVDIDGKLASMVDRTDLLRVLVAG